MNKYTIIMNIDLPEYGTHYASTWSAYSESQAIAEAMRYFAMAGARSVEVLSVVKATVFDRV